MRSLCVHKMRDTETFKINSKTTKNQKDDNMKIVTIVEDSPITGVRYGVVEIPDNCLEIRATSNVDILNAQQQFINTRARQHHMRKTCKAK